MGILPGWTPGGLTPSQRAEFHEAAVELINLVYDLERWERTTQQAINHLKEKRP